MKSRVRPAGYIGKVSARSSKVPLLLEESTAFTVDMLVYQDVPRTPEQYDAFTQELQGASDLICDYTNGLFRLGNVVIVSHPLLERSSDVFGLGDSYSGKSNWRFWARP
jgi:hypothetical protein